MKVDLNGKMIANIAALRAKAYKYLMDDGHEIQKAIDM